MCVPASPASPIVLFNISDKLVNGNDNIKSNGLFSAVGSLASATANIDRTVSVDRYLRIIGLPLDSFSANLIASGSSICVYMYRIQVYVYVEYN